MAQNQADAEKIPGVPSLNRLFAKALWLPKQNSAGDAYTEIKIATEAAKKADIIQAHFEEWKRGCVSAIKAFFPLYVDLGCKYEHLLNSDPVTWAEGKTWRSLRGMCGVAKLGEDGSHDFVHVKWWLGVATELNFEVTLPKAKAWFAPQWLTKSGSPPATDQLFQNFLDRLSLTFFDVLDEEKEHARLRIALNSASSTGPQQGGPREMATGKPWKKSRKRILPKGDNLRRKVIFGAIQTGLKGPKYCKILDERKLPVPTAWTAEECPPKYVDAYMVGTKWRKRIQDEKSRYQRKWDQTPPQEREKQL
jgi:hypothetical protein